MTAGIVQSENLKAVMDAYRDRTGASISIKLVDLPAKIRAIPAQGPGYDASKVYCQAANGIGEIVVESGTTSISPYTFYYFGGKKITLPTTITSIGNYALAEAQYLQNANAVRGPGLNLEELTNLATIGTNAFSHTNGLSGRDINLPSVRNVGGNAFANTYVNSLIFPNTGVSNFAFTQSLVKHLETGYASSGMCNNCSLLEDAKVNLAAALYNNTFGNCPLLAKVILGAPCATINAQSFYNAPKLATLVLKNSDGVSLANVSAFTGTPFEATSTAETPTLYVPQALITSQYYETATNWASLRFNLVAIEGSEYDDA